MQQYDSNTFFCGGRHVYNATNFVDIRDRTLPLTLLL